jgi:hypothetical protein
MSKKTADDMLTNVSDRVRWAKAMCDVMIADQDLQSIHIEAIAGIAGHLRDAQEDLENLYGHVVKPPKPTTVTPIRKVAPDETEPEQGGAA